MQGAALVKPYPSSTKINACDNHNIFISQMVKTVFDIFSLTSRLYELSRSNKKG